MKIVDMARVWLVILLSCALVGVASAAVTPVVALFVSEVTAGNQVMFSAMIIGLNVSGIGCSIGLGFALDKGVSPRLLLSLAGACLCMLYIALAFIDQTWLMLLLLVVLGGPGLGLLSLLFGALKALSGGERGQLYVRAVFCGAWVVGPALSTSMVSANGFGPVFGGASVAVALGVAGLVWRLPSAGSVEQPERDMGALPRDSRAPFKFITGIIALAVLLQTVNHVTVGYAPIFFSGVPGIGLEGVGVALGLCALLEVIVLVGLACLASTPTVGPTVVLAGTLCALGYVLLLPFIGVLWQLLAAQVLNAVFVSAVFGFGLLWLQSVWNHRAGVATAVYVNANRIGGALGAGVMSAGLSEVPNSAPWAVCIIVCVIASALAFMLVIKASELKRFRESAQV